MSELAVQIIGGAGAGIITIWAVWLTTKVSSNTHKIEKVEELKQLVKDTKNELIERIDKHESRLDLFLKSELQEFKSLVESVAKSINQMK